MDTLSEAVRAAAAVLEYSPQSVKWRSVLRFAQMDVVPSCCIRMHELLEFGLAGHVEDGTSSTVYRALLNLSADHVRAQILEDTRAAKVVFPRRVAGRLARLHPA